MNKESRKTGRGIGMGIRAEVMLFFPAFLFS
jgi:hypothetical protein